jgi:hypothetical protein
MSAFLLGIHHFTNASKIIALKVFPFWKDHVSTSSWPSKPLLELHGNYLVLLLDGWM